MTEAEVSAIVQLPKEEKYQYLVQQLIARKEVWIIYDDDGMVLFESDREEIVIPVWPHREVAQLFCAGEYADCQPGTVALADFRKNELTEAVEQQFLISVMPVPDRPALLVVPGQLEKDLSGLNVS